MYYIFRKVSAMLKRLFTKQAKPSLGAGDYNSTLGRVSESIMVIFEERERFNARVNVSKDGALVLRITSKGADPITLLPSYADFIAVVNCIVSGRVGMVTPRDVAIMNSSKELEHKLIALCHYKAKTIGCRFFYTKKGDQVELKLKGRNGYLRLYIADENSCMAKDLKL